MKKYSIVSVLLTVLCVIFLFCGCQTVTPNPEVEGLTSEQTEELRKAVAEESSKRFHGGGIEKYDINRLTIKRYFGTYNGHIVFERFDGNFQWFAFIAEVTIDGVYIEHVNSYGYPVVYLNPEEEYDGDRLLRLDKAYEEGYITKDNLYSIAEAAKKSKE